MEKEKKTQKVKKTGNNANKKIPIFVIGICILVIAVIAIINIVLNNVEYKKYEKYEEKMNKYGFNKLYDNGSAKTSEKVTKSEALKVIIGTCLNTSDISSLTKTPTEDYQNAVWVLYAQDASIVNASEVNKNTSNEKVKYVDVIKYFSNAKKKLLNLELSNEPQKELSDLKKYNGFEQEAILDMLSNDILQEVSGSLKGNKKVFKGKLNEIIVNSVEKYNILNSNIQTDVSQMPNNASEYTYISKDVAKEAYEKEFIVDNQDEFKSPKQSYVNVKQNYTQIKEKIEKYYNTLLNVDYQKTTKESMKSDLDQLTLKGADDKTLEEYISYLKQNTIKLSGEAKVQDPIIYFDGSNYRVRTKLDFKVESSLTTDNLLYSNFENGKRIRFDKKDYSIYADVVLASALGTGTFYLKNASLDLLVKDTNLGISIIGENE